MCVASGVAVLTVDSAGRRPLLLFGVAGMCFSAMLVGIAALISYGSAAVTYISIVGLFGFIGSYQVLLQCGCMRFTMCCTCLH